MSIKTQNNKGFSLLEVLIAMALVVLVMGGVFSIANGALSLGNAMSIASLREMRIASFESQCRYFLANANTDTRLETGSNGAILVVENIGVPFSWETKSHLANAVRFTLKTSRAGLKDVMIDHLKRNPQRPQGNPYEVLGTIDLLQGVRHWKWSFYDERKEEWKTTWSAKDPAPLFVRLTFGLVGDPRDFDYTFWVSKDGTNTRLITPFPS